MRYSRNRKFHPIHQLLKNRVSLLPEGEQRMYFKKDRAIHLVVGMTDMRKQINGLAQLANEYAEPNG